MLTLIARGCDALLIGGPNVPLLRSATVAHFVPRRSGDRPQALSPRVIAAVARHRRP